MNIFPGSKPVTSGNYLPHAEFPWLMAVALVAIVPHFPHLPYWIITVTLSILLYFFLRWQQGYHATSVWIKVPVALCVAAAIAIDFSYNFQFDKASIAALTFCICIKLLELKGRRDVMVIVALGYFLLLTHYFHSQDFLTGIWLFVSALVVTSALLHLYDDPARPALKTLKTAFIMLLQAIPLALVLYLLFPRVDGPLWGIQRMQSSQTGLSGTMRPGQISKLVESNEIAFRVQFQDHIPPRRQLYWRGPVLSNYDGRSWTSNDYRRQEPSIEARGAPARYSIILEPHNRPWLLPLEMPISFSGIPNAYFTSSGVLQSQQPITNRTRMEFVSHPEYRMDRGELSRFARRNNLQLPDGRNRRSLAFAEQLWAENPTPEQMAERLLRFFRDEPFYYTLDPPLLGANAVDDFIFNSRQGFCEHYASAFVVLMRAAGVPTRAVTGYLGGEVNPVDRVLTVRQSAAHAWAEFWTVENGWTRVDPTAVIPPERIAPEILNQQNDNSPELTDIALDALNWLQRARYYWQALDNHWSQWVLDYTPERQRELLSRLGISDLKKISLFFAAVTILFLILVALFILRKQRKSIEPAWAVWLSACKKLNRQGIETPSWETPLALVERLQTTYPNRLELNAALSRLARLVYAVRYENMPVPIRILKQARKQLPGAGSNA
ncbi:MAG: DUF3488 and transglutaminase-like domain-containing protein [Betaproteobacteria bacterium]|nr:DUF3488 and transglutaminase-like domain-containing protein [Betaproteobacteria bacterium]